MSDPADEAEAHYAYMERQAGPPCPDCGARVECSCDDEPPFGDDDPTPMFGCACENPLTVDDVCADCIHLRSSTPGEKGGG